MQCPNPQCNSTSIKVSVKTFVVDPGSGIVAQFFVKRGTKNRIFENIIGWAGVIALFGLISVRSIPYAVVFALVEIGLYSYFYMNAEKLTSYTYPI